MVDGSVRFEGTGLTYEENLGRTRECYFEYTESSGPPSESAEERYVAGGRAYRFTGGHLADGSPANFEFWVNDGASFEVVTAQPTEVFVDAGYAGLAHLTRVDWPFSGMEGDHLIGFDAFVTVEDAQAAVAPGGTVHVAGGAAPASMAVVGMTLSLGGASLPGAAVTVGSGGVLTGTGTVGELTVDSGGTLSPGMSPGTINAGNSVWAGGGSYVWEINDANGSAGGEPGWDLLNISGTLDIAATSADKFEVRVVTLTPPSNALGSMVNFHGALAYGWVLASASGGIVNFDAAKFLLDTTAVANDFSAGTFSIAQDGNDLKLVYTPNAAPTIPGDINQDAVVDRADLTLIIAAVGRLASGPNDPRDLDHDGRITGLDARRCVVLFTYPGGIAPKPAGKGMVMPKAKNVSLYPVD